MGRNGDVLSTRVVIPIRRGENSMVGTMLVLTGGLKGKTNCIDPLATHFCVPPRKLDMRAP